MIIQNSIFLFLFRCRNLSSCGLVGQLPDEFATLTNLEFLDLAVNELTGNVPGIENFDKLIKLTLRDNCLDSLPPLNTSDNAFIIRLDQNFFTFEDIIPNVGLPGLGTHYDFQKCVPHASPIELNEGDSYTIDLGIDEQIGDNVYIWYKDGEPCGACTPVGNTLPLTNVTLADAGVYTCEVTNANAMALTVCTDSIIINIAPGCATADSLILVELFTATNGSNWNDKTYWLEPGQPIDTWYGISTNGDGCVKSISLQNNNLTGSIPSVLGSLSQLQTLYLTGNQLTGNIPGELGSLGNLLTLYLGGNQLSGAIPVELGNLSNLSELALFNNNLSNTIPSELGDLNNLSILSLWGNGLGGNIPTELRFLINLTGLELGDNQLTGVIPAELGELVNLNSLSIYDNQLTGAIPAELGALTNLTTILLHDNQLTAIPVGLGSLSNLNVLSLHHNDLAGAIPADLGDLSNLTQLDLSFNELTGPIPAELGGLSNLTHLFLHENQLTGSIPPEFEGLINLSWLRLYNNNLTGEIPVELASLNKLKTIDLSENQLSGLIPSGFVGIDTLENFRFRDNQFTFKDILPLLPNNIATFVYDPQDSIYMTETIDLEVGQTYTIDLEIDSQVGSNVYTWYKDFDPCGTCSPVGNTLPLNNVTLADAGVYTCRITNPNAMELTLYSRPVTINVTCVTPTAPDLDPLADICISESSLALPDTQDGITGLWSGEGVIGGNTFNPQIAGAGTFSLTFTPDPGQCSEAGSTNINVYTIETNLDEAICEGETFQIGDSTYLEAGNYENQLTSTNGCDSTINLQLTVLDTFITALNADFCSGSSYILNDSTYQQAGTYQQVFMAQNGCDSTVVLQLDELGTFQTNLNESICQGQSFQVGDSTYTVAGNYENLLTATNGCDSMVMLQLSIIDTFLISFNDEFCIGTDYTWNDSTYQEAGTYQQSFISQFGCDSIVTLELTELSIPQTELNETICEGQTFQVGDSSYVETGNFVNTLTASSGCDSLVQLNLTVLDTFQSGFNAVFCTGESYTWNAITYNEAGSFEQIFEAQNGCDSTVTLQLGEVFPEQTDLTETICEGETFEVGDSTYVETGSYQNILTAVNNCDSTVSLELTVLDTFATSFADEFCTGAEYIWNEISYFTPGNYQQVLMAQNGCDSIVTLQLDALEVPEIELTETICEGDNYQIGDSTYTESGDYLNILSADNGCDSIVQLDLTVLDTFQRSFAAVSCSGDSYIWNNITYDQAGTYQQILESENGCDSTVTLNLAMINALQTNLDESICAGTAYR